MTALQRSPASRMTGIILSSLVAESSTPLFTFLLLWVSDALRNTARQVAAGGPAWNRDYGYGIIDPVAAARALGVPIP